MFNFFKKKKTITSGVSLENGNFLFNFQISQEYDEKDDIMEIKRDQIITCINMLNETISDLELEKEDKKAVEDIKNKKGRK